MNPNQYTPEQIKDIEERVEKAKIALKELDLQPGCIVSPVNMGDDCFAFKPVAYLQDTKYVDKVSPLTKADL